MKVWRLYTGEYNTALWPVDENSTLDSSIMGNIIENWTSTDFKAYKKGRHRDYAYFCGGIPVFSKKLVEKLRDIICNDVQLLDINVINLEIEYQLLNVVSIDAVDYSSSIPEKSVAGEWIVDFKKLKFKEELIAGRHIFRLPEFISTRLYVSDDFRDAVIHHKLKGFEFVEVWDSEWTDEKEQAQQEKYEAYLAKLEQEKGDEFAWAEAIKKLEQGETVASGVWKMKCDQKGELYIAKLGLDCEYVWSNSNIIPPVLLGLKWHTVRD